MQQIVQHTPVNTTSSRKREGIERWPYHVTYGTVTVTVYKRQTPSGNDNFMVADDSTGKRRFLSFKTAAEAKSEADKLARRKAGLAEMVRTITTDEAIDYFNSVTRLKPFGVTVDAATSTVAALLPAIGSLSKLHEAVTFFNHRNKRVTKKPVAEAVVEFLKLKRADELSDRYILDLEGRLNSFACDCVKDASTVAVSDIQRWLDGKTNGNGHPLSRQSRRNYRVVLGTFFEFCVARGYAADNPVNGTVKIKTSDKKRKISVFTPVEITRLLEAARVNYPEYVPCIALGAFGGLRSAEIERLEWSDIHLGDRSIIIGADKAKTASRRVVPISDNLAAWLAPYVGREGKVWNDNSPQFYKGQKNVAAATEVKADEENGIKPMKPVKWKQNALRHSYVSFRLAQLGGDAGRVAGECGNSASVIHRHYKELTKPAEAERWFNVRPETADNVITLSSAAQ